MNIKQISYDLLNCLENKKYSELLSTTITNVTIESAYEISSMINSLRIAKGEILPDEKGAIYIFDWMNNIVTEDLAEHTKFIIPFMDKKKKKKKKEEV